MKYFEFMDKNTKQNLFFKEPEQISKYTSRELLQYALGALLYVPAIQINMLEKCLLNEIRGLCAVTICLEDSVGALGIEYAIENLSTFFIKLKKKILENELNIDSLPLIFIRPKDGELLCKIGNILKENKEFITGVVIAKANTKKLEETITILRLLQLNELYIIPIIETTEFINIESKIDAFASICSTIKRHSHRILSIRIGVTDILGNFGIRRDKSMSIYDNFIYKTFASDVISSTQRQEINIPISGGVSEFFNMDNEEILNSYVKELKLDRLNGFVGKTVIHPSQIPVVQAMSVVSYGDYMDAKMILENKDSLNGAMSSTCKERMNEINPHLRWAEKIMKLSQIYGVYNEGVQYEELFKF